MDKPPVSLLTSCRGKLLRCVTLGIALFAWETVRGAEAVREQWPGFRGPGGNGVSKTGTPPIHFGPGSNVVWSVEVAPGHSSPCIWDDRIFLTAARADRLETLCIARADGRVLWTRRDRAEAIEPCHGTSSPASATPCTDGRSVVTYFGSSGLTCYDFEGSVRWQHPLPRPSILEGFGSGNSPVLSDGLVVLARDQEKGSEVMALRIEDGSVAWRVDRPTSHTSWSTPAIWRYGDTKQVVLAGSVRLTAYDLASGRLAWFADGIPSFPATTPVTDGDRLVFSGWVPAVANPEFPAFDGLLAKGGESKAGAIRFQSGNDMVDDWGRGHDRNGDGSIDRGEWEEIDRFWKLRKDNTLLLRAGGAGDVTTSHVAWRAKRGAPHVSSPLLYRNRVYLIEEGGRVTCLNAETGQAVYEQERLGAPGPYYASPLAADGRLYLCSLNGGVTVLTAGDTPKVLASNSLGETTAASPAVVDSTLYIRTARHLYAFGQPKLP